MKKFLVFTLAAAIGATTLAASPEYILPVDAQASSSFTPNNEEGTIANLGGDYTTVSLHTYLTIALVPAAERWVSAAGDLAGGILDGGADPAGAWVSFDLGGQYNLSALHLANGATNTDRNVRDFDIEVSNDNATWTSVSGGAGFNAAVFDIFQPWETFSFTASDVRYVRINIASNNGNVNYTNLSKVLFEGTPNAGQYYVDMSTVSVDTGTLSETAGNPPANMVNDSGVNDVLGGNHAGVTATDTPTANWVSAPGETTGEIVFTLAENTDLQSVIIWNGNDDVNATRGIQVFDILVSSTELADDFVEVVTDDTLGITSDSNIWVPGENVLIDQDNVRRVKLRIDSNYGNTRTMVQEVQFIGRNAAPTSSGSIGYLGLTESSPGVFTVNFDVLTTTDLGTAFTKETLAPADVSVVGGGIEVDISSASSQLFLRVDGN